MMMSRNHSPRVLPFTRADQHPRAMATEDLVAVLGPLVFAAFALHTTFGSGLLRKSNWLPTTVDAALAAISVIASIVALDAGHANTTRLYCATDVTLLPYTIHYVWKDYLNGRAASFKDGCVVSLNAWPMVFVPSHSRIS